MKEREQQTDPYWQHDEAIAEGNIQGESYTIRLRAHESKEKYSERQEIVPVERRGTRTYFHGRPYILVPEYKLTIGLYPQPQGDKIGEVTSSDWEGMRHQEIGNAQAWFYHGSVNLLVIWECFVNDQYRQEDPTKDELLKAVWEGWEHFLLGRLHQVKRIVCPSWEPIYEEDKALWHGFLKEMGYSRLNETAFAKEVALTP